LPERPAILGWQRHKLCGILFVLNKLQLEECPERRLWKAALTKS
jgi:hypothetical protein